MLSCCHPIGHMHSVFLMSAILLVTRTRGRGALPSAHPKRNPPIAPKMVTFASIRFEDLAQKQPGLLGESEKTTAGVGGSIGSDRRGKLRPVASSSHSLVVDNGIPSRSTHGISNKLEKETLKGASHRPGQLGKTGFPRP
jgi:hypothetical protein